MKTHVLSTCASQMIGFTKEKMVSVPQTASRLWRLRMGRGKFHFQLKTKKTKKPNENQWFLQCETIKTKKPNENTCFEHMCFTNDWFY